MTTIIVPLDGSLAAERAIPVGEAFARRLRADLVVVRSPGDRSPEDVTAYLDAVIDRLAPDIDTLGKVIDGSPDEAVHDLIARYDDPILCLHSHGRSGLGHLVLGSESERILARSAVPAITAGPARREDWALDGGPVGFCIDANTDPAAAARFVATWAQSLDVPVHVLTVRSEDGRPISRFHPASRVQMAAAVEHLVTAGVHVQSTVLEDLLPAHRLARYAEAHGIAMLIAGKRRSGPARDLLGSTTMNLVHHSPCPVLVMPVSAPTPALSPSHPSVDS